MKCRISKVKEKDAVSMSVTLSELIKIGCLNYIQRCFKHSEVINDESYIVNYKT